MGRSFDRGGQSRKERMRGKRRAFQQAERDREARDAVRQARHSDKLAAMAANTRQASNVTATLAASTVTTATVTQIPQASATATHKQPGFFTRAISRLFGKAA